MFFDISEKNIFLFLFLEKPLLFFEISEKNNVLAEYLRNIVLKELTKKTVKNRQKTVRSGSVRVNFGPKFPEPKI